MTTISTRTDYGIRVLAAIAERGIDATVSLGTIAQEKKLPLRYIAQIAVQMKRAGLLTSKEGVGGGYRLARPAQDIRVSDVFDALEGQVLPLQCEVDHANRRYCTDKEHCTSYRLWLQLRVQMQDLLSRTTIASLATANA
ncbi:MAG: Rrf2 family transcriptional regulator [Candidatus Kerfeldbacteria bacterium]|nr:Rrf2 family transcriptional regulator [Candidatus Kerfeldbacteria bacterium]